MPKVAGMSNSERLSLHALARLAGCTKAAVLKATRTARLHRGEDGKIPLDDGDTRLFIEQIRLRRDHEDGRIALDAEIEGRRRSASAEPAPVVGAPAERVLYPALQASDIDLHSPVVLDTLDALDNPVRVGLVERAAVVNLVQALYSVLLITPTDETSLALDPFDLARKVSNIFADFLAFALESDIDRILAETESAISEKLMPGTPEEEE
jgi:hypothetical protein